MTTKYLNIHRAQLHANQITALRLNCKFSLNKSFAVFISLSLSFPFHLIDVVRGRQLMRATTYHHNCRLKNSFYVAIFHFRFLITFDFGKCHLIVFTARIHLKLSTASQCPYISLAINELASFIDCPG